jgi:hypothetical protein
MSSELGILPGASDLPEEEAVPKKKGILSNPDSWHSVGFASKQATQGRVVSEKITKEVFEPISPVSSGWNNGLAEQSLPPTSPTSSRLPRPSLLFENQVFSSKLGGGRETLSWAETMFANHNVTARQHWINSSKANLVICVVIVASGVASGVETEISTPDNEHIFRYMDLAFSGIFALELAMRLRLGSATFEVCTVGRCGELSVTPSCAKASRARCAELTNPSGPPSSKPRKQHCTAEGSMEGPKGPKRGVHFNKLQIRTSVENCLSQRVPIRSKCAGTQICLS